MGSEKEIEWPTDDELRRMVARSEVAQGIASDRQEAELQRLIPEGPVRCVVCDKPIEKQEMIGFENDAVVMKSYAGYGSRHDTSVVWCVICDDCVEAKCLTVCWLKHLHEATNELRSTPGGPAAGNEG